MPLRWWALFLVKFPFMDGFLLPGLALDRELCLGPALCKLSLLHAGFMFSGTLAETNSEWLLKEAFLTQGLRGTDKRQAALNS